MGLFINLIGILQGDLYFMHLIVPYDCKFNLIADLVFLYLTNEHV